MGLLEKYSAYLKKRNAKFKANDQARKDAKQMQENSYHKEIGRQKAQSDWKRVEAIRKKKEAHIRKLQKYGFKGVCDGKV